MTEVVETYRIVGENQVGAAFNQILRQSKSTADKVASNFRTAFTGVATYAIARFVASAAAAGDEMLTLATRTGRSVESLSQLDFIARRSNTSIESLLKSQDQFAKKLGATDEEGKAAVKALDELGLTANKLRTMSPDQQLDAIAEAMESITDPTARARIEMALLGKAGTDLDPVLRGGAAGLKAMREEADRLGLTMTTLEAERLQHLDDQIEATTALWRKMKTELVSLIATPVAAYLEIVTQGLMGWKVMLGATGLEMEDLNNRFEELIARRRTLQDEQKHIGVSARRTEELDAIKAEMALIKEKQEYLFQEGQARAHWDAAQAAERARQADASDKAKKKLEDEAEAAKEAAKSYARMTAEIKAAVDADNLMNELEVRYPTALLDKDQFDAELAKTGGMVQDQADENQKIFSDMYQELATEFTETQDAMSVVADQGWRNLQSAAAEFFFDPFKDGLDGMLLGFVNILRQMVAEAAAAKLFEALGAGSSGGGILGTILGAAFGAGTGGFNFGATNRASGYIGGALGLPTRRLAAGGYLAPGEAAVVGEGGFPELAIGGPAGTTIKPMRSGRPTQISIDARTTVDARGASADLQKALPAILKDHADRLEGRVVERLRRNIYRL